MGSRLLPPLPDPSTYDVVVAAGDISYELQGIRWLEKFFPQDKPILFVPGNHEYYTNDWNTVKQMFKNYDGRVTVLDPGVAVIDDVTFIGATMWSDLKLEGFRDLSDYNVKRCIADFRWGWTPSEMKMMHDFEQRYVDHELACTKTDKVVVVTHWVPTQLATSPRFKGDPYNPYFINDQDWLMEQYKYDLHIFGHTHDRFDFVHPSGVRCINNCHGYVSETPGFKWKIVDI